jgi:competence protein ComEC
MGRMYQSLRILLFTAVVLIFLKPVWINDMGFWLSVLATASIVIFYPKIKKIFVFLPKIVREDWSTTLSAQIGVVPLLYYNFGQFNILSPFINVAVLWTVVPITLIGMISGIIGTIYQPLGRFLLYLCYPFTSWFLFVISGFT